MEIEGQSSNCITDTNNTSETKVGRLYFVSPFRTIQHQNLCMSTRPVPAVVTMGIGTRKLHWQLEIVSVGK